MVKFSYLNFFTIYFENLLVLRGASWHCTHIFNKCCDIANPHTTYKGCILDQIELRWVPGPEYRLAPSAETRLQGRLDTTAWGGWNSRRCWNTRNYGQNSHSQKKLTIYNIWGVSRQLSQRAAREPQIVLFLIHVYDTKKYFKKLFDKCFRRIFSSAFQWCR